MKSVYLSILVMTIISVIISYYITWNSMLDDNTNYHHLNRVYHSLLMGSLMASIEIGMLIITGYGKKRKYLYIAFIMVVLLSILFWRLIRDQKYITEEEFYKSMIQHHESALFMARRVLKREDISENLKNLATNIIQTQTKEINDMKSWLRQNQPQ